MPRLEHDQISPTRPTLKQAIEILVLHLETNPDYRRAWQANIAMSMMDADNYVSAEKGGILPHQWHLVFNRGAEQFLRNLCMDQTGE